MRLTAKNTIKTIIEQGDDYVITVKANQKLLYQRVCAITQDCMPVDVYVHSERGHHRLIQRTIEVFDCLAGIAQDWLGLRRLVRVQRQGTRNGKPYTQQSYYITSLATTARQFADGFADIGVSRIGCIGSKMSSWVKMIVHSNSIMHPKTGD